MHLPPKHMIMNDEILGLVSPIEYNNDYYGRKAERGSTDSISPYSTSIEYAQKLS